MSSSTRRLWVGFATGLLASAAIGANCNPQSVFACSTDEACMEQGEGGRCEENNACSFPDPECPEGRRWHDRAAIEAAGMCWGEDGDETGDGGESTGAPSSTTSTTSQTSTTGGSTTTSSDDDTAPGDDTTDESTSSPPASCDEQYGDVADYMLCEETAESCSFNATLGMTISCDDVCSMFGGSCIEALLNEDDLCVSTGPTDCGAADVADNICVCTRD